jgi:hypothetical protein
MVGDDTMSTGLYRIVELPDGRWQLKRDGAKKPSGTYASLFEASSRAAELVERRPNCTVSVEKEGLTGIMPGKP